MTITEIKLYYLTPEPGYVFHSLENDETYSDGLYTKDMESFINKWEEIPDPNDDRSDDINE